MYPMTRKDNSGETLDGSKHNYTLTFAAGQFPPVSTTSARSCSPHREKPYRGLWRAYFLLMGGSGHLTGAL